MDPNRAQWNQDQQALRQALARSQNAREAIALFFRQHAAVHASVMSGSTDWSFADEVCLGLDPDNWRRIPPGGEHSLAWIFWHLARIEDVTMNLLVADGPQVLQEDDWAARLGVAVRDTGNLMLPQDVAALSAAIHLGALQEYRQAVGRRTRQIVSSLSAPDFSQKVLPERLARIRAEGAVAAAAGDLLDYWGGLTIAGLLLMPPTRHCFVHLNEALRMLPKLRRR